MPAVSTVGVMVRKIHLEAAGACCGASNCGTRRRALLAGCSSRGGGPPVAFCRGQFLGAWPGGDGCVLHCAQRDREPAAARLHRFRNRVGKSLRLTFDHAGQCPTGLPGKRIENINPKGA